MLQTPIHTPLQRLTLKYLSKHITVSQAKLKEFEALSHANTVVYILPTAHWADFLLLQSLCFKFKLPMPHGVLGLKTDSDRKALLEKMLRVSDDRKALCLFLRRGSLTGKSGHHYEKVWEKTLSELNNTSSLSIMAPLFFTWTQHPVELKPSAFHTNHLKPMGQSNLQKLVTLIFNRSNLRVTLGEPLVLSTFVNRISKDQLAVASKKLRRTFASYFHRETHSISGPPLQSAQRIIRSILKDQQLQQEITGFSERRKTTPMALEKAIKTYLHEIISLYNPLYLETACHLFSRLKHKMFDRIVLSDRSIERLKEASKRGALLILPNHRSHMDYLVISYLFFLNHLSLPRIAAGINLSFFPVGFIFRRCGAYFIRRSLNGDQLYSKTLKAYVRWLVQHDITQEFFIEGGRSRTGRLLYPKLGLLTFQVESFLRHPSRDVLIMPTSVMYDWVPEQLSLSKECMGEKKAKENAAGLLGIWAILNKNHGDMHIEIGTPISLKLFFHEEISAGQLTASKHKIRTLGTQTLSEISRISKVTPSLLASTVILTFNEYFTYEEFLASYQTLKECLPADRFNDKKEGAQTFWVQGIREGWIIEHHQGYFSIENSVRHKLDYHRQSILHIFSELALALNHDELTRILNIEFPLSTAKNIDFLRQSKKHHLKILDVFRSTQDIHQTISELGANPQLDSLIKTLEQKWPHRPEMTNRLLLQNSLEKSLKTKFED